MNTALRKRQIALLGLFFVAGMAMGSWVTRVPAIRDILGVNNAEMGIILSFLAVGSFLGIVMSGPLVSRWGARNVVAVTFLINTVGLPITGLGVFLVSVPLTSFGLFLIGLGAAAGDVGMNVEGGKVEEETGHVFMTYLHGGFSLGNLLGAIIGMGAQAYELHVLLHLCIVAIINFAIIVWCIPKLPARTGYTGKMFQRRVASFASAQQPVWKDWRLIAIGVIVMTLALSEGTANDWLPLVMVDGHGVSNTGSTVVYVIFVAAMTLTRFISGWFVERFGSGRVLSVSAVFVVIALAVIAFVDNTTVAIAAAVLWGIGAASGFPLALSAAGRSGHNPTARVAIASITGYLAFLSGPPVLGFAGQAWGLRNALIIPMIGACLAVVLAPVTNIKRPGGGEARNDEARSGEPRDA